MRPGRARHRDGAAAHGRVRLHRAIRQYAQARGPRDARAHPGMRHQRPVRKAAVPCRLACGAVPSVAPTRAAVGVGRDGDDHLVLADRTRYFVPTDAAAKGACPAAISADGVTGIPARSREDARLWAAPLVPAIAAMASVHAPGRINVREVAARHALDVADGLAAHDASSARGTGPSRRPPAHPPRFRPRRR